MKSPFRIPVFWSLEDPFLYEVKATLSAEGQSEDRVNSYFGMREIGVAELFDLGHRYVALNGEPIYLQLTLDQAYHPEGYYTFPSDEFMRNEILCAKRLGLISIRIQVKTGIPRKLYWADRLGVLVMADVPNSWGEPVPEMRRESEHALRGMIERDYNHPSIFAWVLFNETWGLLHNREYKIVVMFPDVGTLWTTPSPVVRPQWFPSGSSPVVRVISCLKKQIHEGHEDTPSKNFSAPLCPCTLVLCRSEDQGRL